MKQVLSKFRQGMKYRYARFLLVHCFVKLQNRRNLRQMSRANLASPLQERTACQQQVPPPKQGSRKVRQTFWERGGATQRLSFRIYAETI